MHCNPNIFQSWKWLGHYTSSLLANFWLIPCVNKAVDCPENLGRVGLLIALQSSSHMKQTTGYRPFQKCSLYWKYCICFKQEVVLEKKNAGGWQGGHISVDDFYAGINIVWRKTLDIGKEETRRVTIWFFFFFKKTFPWFSIAVGDKGAAAWTTNW